MKRLLVLLFVLFVTISAVSAADNLTASSSGDGDIVLDDGADIISENDSVDGIVNEGDTDGDASDSTGNASDNVSAESDLTIQGKDLVWYVKAKPVYKFKIADSNGTGVAVENVTLKLKGNTYSVNTNENGIGQLPITNLKAGTYYVTVKYQNLTSKNKIKLFSSRITPGKDISSVYGKKVKYKIRLLNNSGKPMVGEKVTFTIGKKVYVKKIDCKGYASVWLKYNSGKYVIKYSADKFSGKNKYTVKNYVSLEILKWGLKADVKKASLIKNNMPNNKWVKKAVAATKKGLPLITIKGGKGKTVFMTAGIHGDELNSQVAAMKMIKYLTTHSIKGTVYIIPFVNVKAISQKVRLTNYDFNRVAHVSGTVSNNIIKLILKKKCDAYGDFHSTVWGGVPGLNVVLGYTSSNECIKLTNYIVNYAKLNKIFYYPGQKYQWTLADYCNYKGTPAVICEVISPVNAVSSHATGLSYKQMTGFLKFNSII